jgi:hypothetical protein
LVISLSPGHGAHPEKVAEAKIGAAKGESLLRATVEMQRMPKELR